MNRKLAILAIAFLFTFLFVACSSYYKVTDPGSGSTYYTSKIKKKSSGFVEFEDANTGSTVTLQSSEVKEINKEEYRANTPKD